MNTFLSSYDNVKVSVVIPTYNAELYLAQALESILNQTEQSFEIIICDDLSTDNTIEIVEIFKSKDDRVRLIRNQQNKGPSFSRNRAISEASGTWVALLDADDFYHTERLQRLIEIGEFHNADMVADYFSYVDAKGDNPKDTTPNNKTKNSCETLNIIEFIKNDFPTKNGVKYGYLKPIMRRSFLILTDTKYDEEVRLGEDSMLYIECLLKGAEFILLNESFYYYREVNYSLSRTSDNTGFNKLSLNNKKILDIAKNFDKPQVVSLLNQKQKEYDALVVYSNLVKHLKEGSFFRAVYVFFTNPWAWTICIFKVNVYIIKYFNNYLKLRD